MRLTNKISYFSFFRAVPAPPYGCLCQSVEIARGPAIIHSARGVDQPDVGSVVTVKKLYLYLYLPFTVNPNIFVLFFEHFCQPNYIAKLQIKPKSKSNQTKNLERLYIWVVVCCLFVVRCLSQRWL